MSSTATLLARYHRLGEKQRLLRASAVALGAEKHALVVQLREQLSVQQIADELGVTRAHVYNMIWAANR
jgi:AcrR family transcriptional regulator